MQKGTSDHKRDVLTPRSNVISYCNYRICDTGYILQVSSNGWLCSTSDKPTCAKLCNYSRVRERASRPHRHGPTSHCEPNSALHSGLSRVCHLVRTPVHLARCHVVNATRPSQTRMPSPVPWPGDETRAGVACHPKYSLPGGGRPDTHTCGAEDLPQCLCGPDLSGETHNTMVTHINETIAEINCTRGTSIHAWLQFQGP